MPEPPEAGPSDPATADPQAAPQANAPRPASRPAPRKLPYRGAAISLLLIILLVTPPTELLEQKGAWADTRANFQTPDATPITVRSGLTDDPSETIPRSLGVWNGTDDESWDEILQDSLAYDTLLVRHYSRPGFFEPVQLMVLTARHAQAFHDPTICFRYQGGVITDLGTTSVEHDGQDVPVGRMSIEYDEERPRLVYNLYLVQEKFASAQRTTWVRLSFSGAGPDQVDELEPYLTDLFDQIAPYAYEAHGGAKTTFEAIGHGVGWWAAGLAAVVALVPVVADTIRIRRR